MIHKFHLPFHAITGHKLGVTSCADGSGGPIALRTSPLASGLPLTCKALPFAGGASAPYLPGCARQLLTVRCAHYAEGASRSTFGFVTIVPRYLLGQVMPSHSFAARTRAVVRRVNGDVALLICHVNSLGDQPRLACSSSRTPPGGALACAPGSGTLPSRREPALVVRRVKGGTTLLMYRVNGLGDQSMPASASRPHAAGCTPYFLTSFRISLRA